MANETKSPTWIEVCSRQLAGHRLHDFALETLRCFDRPHPRSDDERTLEPVVPASLKAFSASYDSAFEALSRGSWRDDVDPALATLFTRRLQAVDELLGQLTERDVGRILRLGLRVRMKQIVSKGVWPAVRLRALADFYYSRAVLVRYGISDLNANLLRARAAKTAWHPVSKGAVPVDGIWESHYEQNDVWGPQHIRALKIDLQRFRIETLDLRSEGTEHAGLTASLHARGAIAGSSGGFFLYSEPDIASPSAQFDPVGMILRDKEMSHPPIENRAALLFGEGRAELRRVGLADVRLHYQGIELDTSSAIHRSQSRMGPACLSICVSGHHVHEVGTSLPVPLNGFVLPWRDAYGPVPSVGSSLSWTGPTMSSGALAEEGLSGGPLLLLDGEPCLDYRAEGFWGSAPPLTFSQDETGDRNLLARLVVGIDASGFLYMVAIDGRQADRALGLSLAGCAAWLQGLGCIQAANMDGGSSKRLALLGEVMDAPTTEVATSPSGDHETKTRPVYTGLAIIAR